MVNLEVVFEILFVFELDLYSDLEALFHFGVVFELELELEIGFGFEFGFELEFEIEIEIDLLDFVADSFPV